MNLATISVRENSYPISRGSLYNTNDIAAAWCFGSRHHYSYLTPVEELGKYDGLFVTMWKMKTPKEERWLDKAHQFKDTYPDKKLILHQEAEAEWFLMRRGHEWDMQRSMMELLDKVDLFLAHTKKSADVYSFFVRNGSVRVWDTVQDLEYMHPLAMDPKEKNPRRLILSTYDGRANGLLAAAVASQLNYPILHLTRSTYKDNRNEYVAKHFGFYNVIEVPTLAWIKWLEAFREGYVYLHPMPAASAGRDTIVAGALGIPVVGNKELDCQEYLFPRLGVGCYDTVTMSLKTKQLFDNEQYYQAVRKDAMIRAERYSIENGEKRARMIMRDIWQK
jgi:hypothetical protein